MACGTHCTLTEQTTGCKMFTYDEGSKICSISPVFDTTLEMTDGAGTKVYLLNPNIGKDQIYHTANTRVFQ